MVFPGSMSFAGAPSYPWAPEMIEEFPEWERSVYLELLRSSRKEMGEMLSEGSKKRK
jgi:hypothetical protein